MYIVQRTVRFVRGFVMSYGPSQIKKRLWDQEFSGGKWNFIDNTVGDCVYPHIEKHARNGRILDLGCGPGNTATELAANAYRAYVGVDISAEALMKAAKRTESSGRTGKNDFVQADFLSYEPTERFDVVLFRESMYHIPLGKIKPILAKYSQVLTDEGVFIVRMYALENGKIKHRPTKMFDIIEDGFDILEKCLYEKSGATAVVIVFRPRHTAREH
jgi:SAM-dependent methyltransferase